MLLALPLGLWLDQDALTVAGLAALIPLLHRPAAMAAGAGAARPDLLLRLGEASFGVYLCWASSRWCWSGVLRLTEPGRPGGSG